MKNKKKIVVGITIPGSVGLLEGQLKYFHEAGFETYLMAPKDERSINYCERENCKLLEIEISRQISIINDIKSLFQIIKILRQVKPDVVNFGTPKISLLGLIAAKITGVKNRIFTCRGFRFEHEKGFLKWLLRVLDTISSTCAHQIICISPSVKELGVKLKIFPSSKAIVINKGSSNGLNLSKFRFDLIQQNDKTNLRANLKIDSSHFIFGFIGRINNRKGIRELYTAFCKIYEKNTFFRLLIIGPLEETQTDDDIINNIYSHPGILMVGRTDDIPKFLSIMDVFVLPTWAEGFGNVLIQASAMGIPVISTFTTGAKDAVSNGYNGILVPVKDSFSLENAMIDLYNDELKRLNLGRNGIEWSKNFENKIIWEGLEKLYNVR